MKGQAKIDVDVNVKEEKESFEGMKARRVKIDTQSERRAEMILIDEIDDDDDVQEVWRSLKNHTPAT
eukprot:scaffold15800_cov78-Skeletonema_dohrnii-CCMP3373.AAC.1